MSRYGPRPSARHDRRDRRALHVRPRTPPDQFRPSTPAQPPTSAALWDALLRVEPGLGQFVEAARQAGRNNWCGWLAWVRTFGEFRALVRQAAEGLGVGVDEACRAVEAHLGRIHRDNLPADVRR